MGLPSLSPILGGALGVSLLVNVGLDLALKHNIAEAALCKQATVEATAAATKTQLIVEKRDAERTNEVSNAANARIDDIRMQFNKGRGSHLSSSTSAASLTARQGGASVILPDPRDQQLNDERISEENTVKAETWQEWYSSLQNIRKEENGTDK